MPFGIFPKIHPFWISFSLKKIFTFNATVTSLLTEIWGEKRQLSNISKFRIFIAVWDKNINLWTMDIFLEVLISENKWLNLAIKQLAIQCLRGKW